MKYAFFPGCTIPGRLPFIEKSIRLVLPEFDINLEDLAFTCCPEPNSVRSFSNDTWLTLGARNLAVAEAAGLDILSACSGCFESLSMVKHKIDGNEELKEKVNTNLSKIGMEYTGETKVKHIIQVLAEDIGTDDIIAKVTNPLKQNAVTHPGCHLLRPQNILDVDDAEEPVILDKLVGALGMEPLSYMDQTMCCGAGIRGVNRDASFGVLKEKMNSMMMVSPDAIVVFCPTCFITFESGQRVINRMFDLDFEIPVYYYTELLAAAMNLEGTDMVLAEHRVKSDIKLIQEVTQSTSKTH